MNQILKLSFSKSKIIGLLILILAAAPNILPADQMEPFQFLGYENNPDAYRVQFEVSNYFSLKSLSNSVTVAFPISPSEFLNLELERMHIVSEDAEFVIYEKDGNIPISKPEVVTYRGKIAGQPLSDVYLALTGQGSGNGFITTESGEQYFISQDPMKIGQKDNGGLVVIKGTSVGGYPEFKQFCQAIMPEGLEFNEKGIEEWVPASAGPGILNLALECDQAYVDLFSDQDAAVYYAVQVIGAISYIYTRDLDMKLMIKFFRIYPNYTEPFDINEISTYRQYWWNYEDDSDRYNIIHLLSGRRTTSFGGIAYVGGTCGNWAWSITAYINGSFIYPLETPSVFSWDINCPAHEMGHNMGAPHTHDENWFYPTIDDCGNGLPGRSTLMSYCHTYPGVNSNISLNFHRRIVDFVKNEAPLYGFQNYGCYEFDCNNNGVYDSRDIKDGFSLDINDNGIPDECEDCNGNSIFDDVDIAGGMPDINGNGLPDECEEDCNGNSIPDKFEIFSQLTDDVDGNYIPDECQPDCDENGIPDVQEILTGTKIDYNHNFIIDDCEDCNDNGIADIIDLNYEFNFYVACGPNNVIREYNGQSGVPMRILGAGTNSFPNDVVFGPDNYLYVTNLTNNTISRIDVDAGTSSVFVSSGSGGLDFPMNLTFGPDDNLYVGSWNTDCILRFDGSTGAFIDTFVTPNAGGLQKPFGLEFGPNGNLFVAGVNSAAYEYSGADGSFIGIFVTAGDGGLNGARGIAFGPDGDLYVAGYNSHNIYRYDGTSGAFKEIFNDIYNPTYPVGLRFGPNGNLFVVQSDPSNTWIREYVYPLGQNSRRIVRNDPGLGGPTGIAFRPKSANDADGNYILDVCDNCIDTDGDGFGDPGYPTNTCFTDNCPDIYNPDQSDWDADGIGDACDACIHDPYDDVDNDGFCGDVDNCPHVPNDPQIDTDGDGIGDACDNCAYADNKFQDDIDNDNVGDICDNCLNIPNNDQTNSDTDNLGDACDNCPNIDNDDQADMDSDTVGDLCDNCPEDYNPEQNDICSFMCGDADNNKAINILDITFLISYLYKGGTAPASLWAADPDGNGTINILDITYLISFLYKDGPDPVCQ
ncbi:MAG: M12 family metallo-peptidase [Candidatus Zixiibacteriota bacterium]